MTTSTIKTWRQSLSHWTIDLIVVFIGVYSAFLLSEYRAEKEADAHRAQIVQALKAEIEGITLKAHRISEGLHTMVADYDSAIAEGAMPSLQPMIEPIRAESHMWEATLQMGGLNHLDVLTMYRISEFYNALNAGLEQLAQLRHLSETVLIPNLDREPEEFYDPETEQLLKKYTWYLDGLRRASVLAAEVEKVGEALIQDLEKTGIQKKPA